MFAEPRAAKGAGTNRILGQTRTRHGPLPKEEEGRGPGRSEQQGGVALATNLTVCD